MSLLRSEECRNGLLLISANLVACLFSALGIGRTYRLSWMPRKPILHLDLPPLHSEEVTANLKQGHRKHRRRTIWDWQHSTGFLGKG